MKTPLAERHVALGARMAPFAGWDMPIQYAGILKEHEHTRKAVSVFDICHMGEFFFSGPQAAALLDRMLTQRAGGLSIGQARYGYLLNDEGHTLDDVIVFRLAEDRFMLVVNAGTRAKDAAWIHAHLTPGVDFVDRSDEIGKLDVQGPDSKCAVEAAFGVTLPDLKFFSFVEMDFGDIPVLVSRTGYTGEFGYELFFPMDQTVAFWDQLLTVPSVKPAGLGARDTLRLEMGYPLYGHELNESRTPAGLARKPFIDLDKDFVGKSAVVRDLERGCDKLVGLRLDGRRAAREGSRVLQGGTQVGIVTSGSFAPSLGVAAALALVAPAVAADGTGLTVEGAGFQVPATVIPIPLYTQGTARRK